MGSAPLATGDAQADGGAGEESNRVKLKRNQTRLSLCNRLVVSCSGAGLQGHPHTGGCSFLSAAMEVPQKAAGMPAPPTDGGMGCGQGLGVPAEPVSVPVCPVPTLLPSLLPGAQVGAGAHPRLCACWQVQHHIREMCRDLQGSSFGAGVFRTMNLLVLLAFPQGTQGKLLQLFSNLHLGVLHPKRPKIAVSGFHTADGEPEIVCD